MTKRLRYTIVGLFFISGVSSIVYQIIWQRYLTFTFGSETLSTTIIVSIYMLGLGLGSYLGGLMSDKMDDLNRLGLYVLIELVIAIFGVCSNYILYDILYQKLSASSLLVSILTSFTFLLPPTVAMGSTLPLLSKLFGTSLTKIKVNTYLLYALNTLGAAFGALVPIFLILPKFGFDGLIYFAAGLNLVCVFVTVGIYRFYKTLKNPELPDTHQQNDNSPEIYDLNWYLLFGVSGFVALSLEMIWFRALQIMLKGDSFTFPILLSVYLTGIALGSIAGIRYLPKIKNTTQLFFRLQGLIVLYCLFSFLGLYLGLKTPGLFDSVNQYLYSYEGLMELKTLLIKSSLLLFLILPPTFLMGVSFVCLQEASNHSVATFGKNLGTLLFFNIGFSSVSVLITTFILFNYFGTSLTLVLLVLVVIVLFVYKLLFVDKIVKQRLEGVLTILIATLGIVTFPSNQSLWKVLQGSHEKEILLTEDKSSISTIKLDFAETSTDVVFLNGLGQSHFPYISDYGHLQLGYLPVLIHPDPKKIAIIGFGSGGTLYASSRSKKTRQVDCFEISTNQYDLVRKYHQLINDQTVSGLFNDKRIRLHVEDGRKALLNSHEYYDIIEADALRPNSPFSGNIYSVDFFELVKSRLNPDGFAVSWAPTDRIKNSFAKVFPYTYTDGFIIIGSKSEIPLRLTHEIKEEFKNLPIDWEQGVQKLERIKYNSSQEINSDLFPRDEYNSRLESKVAKLLNLIKASLK